MFVDIPFHCLIFQFCAFCILSSYNILSGREEALLHAIYPGKNLFRISAESEQTRSEAVEISYDTACAGVRMDLLVVADESG